MKKLIALLIVDVQQGLDEPYWRQRNNPNAEQQIKKLLDKWRADKQPIIHIQHCSVDVNSPLHPSKPGNAFKSDTRPQGDEVVFQKKVNSAFIGTNLQAHLRQQGINELVIVRLTTLLPIKFMTFTCPVCIMNFAPCALWLRCWITFARTHPNTFLIKVINASIYY